MLEIQLTLSEENVNSVIASLALADGFVKPIRIRTDKDRIYIPVQSSTSRSHPRMQSFCVTHLACIRTVRGYINRKLKNYRTFSDAFVTQEIVDLSYPSK